jgi:DNA-binding NarL/FixJ family response regulator
MLNEHSNISVIGEADSGVELITKYYELSPDLLIVDIAMPGMTGLESVSKIKEDDPEVKALFLSMYDGDEYIYKVLKSGGSGLVNKSILEGELISAIERVFEGKKYFRNRQDDLSLNELIFEFESKFKVRFYNQEENMNYREEQIIALLKQGLSSQDMADKLNLSKKTIDFYRSCLMKKFNLKTGADLIRFAVQYHQPENKTHNY